jgi:hypothetical protein
MIHSEKLLLQCERPCVRFQAVAEFFFRDYGKSILLRPFRSHVQGAVFSMNKRDGE